jgi:hydroxymethylpyrimidine pyrophosphatase-like HAD family hydrolase
LTFKSPKSILISTDVDDCLIPWENRRRNGPFDEADLRRAVEVTQSVRQDVALHWNTGRNLASLKNLVEPTAKTRPILEAMTLDFLSTNNGQELYVNRENLPTCEWIRALKEADSDPCWREDIEKRTGWSLSNVVGARADVLKALGFSELQGDEAQRLMIPTYRGLRVYVKLTGDHLLSMQCFDTQPGFRVSEWQEGQGHLDTPLVEETGVLLQKELQTALQDRFGTETTLSHKAMEAGGAHFKAFTLFPCGVNKGAVLTLLLETYLEAPCAVITAGDDDYNDLELLSPIAYKAAGHEILNYPVVVGENENARRAVMNNPNHEWVPVGQWDQGIARQLQKIRVVACNA